MAVTLSFSQIVLSDRRLKHPAPLVMYRCANAVVRVWGFSSAEDTCLLLSLCQLGALLLKIHLRLLYPSPYTSLDELYDFIRWAPDCVFCPAEHASLAALAGAIRARVERFAHCSV